MTMLNICFLLEYKDLLRMALGLRTYKINESKVSLAGEMQSWFLFCFNI